MMKMRRGKNYFVLISNKFSYLLYSYRNRSSKGNNFTQIQSCFRSDSGLLGQKMSNEDMHFLLSYNWCSKVTKTLLSLSTNQHSKIQSLFMSRAIFFVDSCIFCAIHNNLSHPGVRHIASTTCLTMKSVICLLKLGSLDAFHKDHDHKIVGSACAVSQRKIYFLPICYLVNQPPTTIISTTTLITCEIKRRGSNLAKQYNFKKQKLPGFLSTKMAGGVRLARHQTHLLYCELLYWFRVHSFVVS